MRAVINQFKPKVKSIQRRIKLLFYSPAERRHALVGPGELWKMKRDFQIDFLKREGLQPQHYLLDVGCGTLRGGIPLIQYLEKGHYHGIEVREEVLREGRQELREAGLEGKAPVLIATGVSGVDLTTRFDYLWAFSVLMHLTDELVDDCFRMVAAHLADGGRFYANVNTDLKSQPRGKWQGFPVVRHSVAFYAQAAERHGLQCADIGSLKELGHVSGDQHQDGQRMLRFWKG
jgi:SAM-dependent methyltransferase